MLLQAARNFAQQESTMKKTALALQNMETIQQVIGSKVDSMQGNVKKLEYIKEQVNAMER